MMAEVNTEKMNQSDNQVLKCGRVYSVNNLNKDEKLFIRVTAAEKAKLEQKAEEKGLTMSKMIRDLLAVAYL